jgi:hypothetical protein
MQNANKVHIYIPRVELSHTEEYIRNALAYDLSVERVEFFPRTNEKGHKYNGAVVIVNEWTETVIVYKTRCETTSSKLYLTIKDGKEYKFTHWPNKYWILTKHTEAVKADATKAEATKAEATKADATKADATKADATKADATKAEATKEEEEEENKKVNENTHVYIVRAEHHHNEEYIKRAFSEIAVISQMTFVPKKNEKGQTYNGVVLLIREWINKTNGMLDTLNESKEYRHNHCAKYHWLMTRHQIDWVPPTEEAIAGKVEIETTDV